MGKLFVNTIEKQNKENKHAVSIINDGECRYISILNAHLRLRLDVHMDRSNVKLSKCAVGTCVDLGSGIILANSRTNMNPFLVKAKTDSEHALYIIVESSHKIVHVELSPGTIIKNTFNCKGEHVGAIMSFGTKQNDIVTVYAESEDKLYRFKYSFNGTVKCKVDIIKSLDIIAEIKEKGKFSNNKFKVTNTRPFTNYYLVSSQKVDRLKALLEKNNYFGSKSPVILIIDGDESTRKAVDTIKENKIKVVSEYGYLLPLEYVNELKLNAIFTINNEGKLNCLRSK